jgi:glycosyltransferase involved in cell wall biosynthesis
MDSTKPLIPVSELSRPRVIAAIPAYNEEKYIGTIVLQAKQYVDEVIVLDDGSTDRTSIIAKLAGAVVLRHDTNKGKGAAIRSLIGEIKNHRADIVVFLDADAQHNPDEIPRVIKPITDGFDLVIGSRQGQAGKTPFYRRIGQKVLLYSNKAVSGIRLTDSESGFRALCRQALFALNLTENGFAIESEMIIQASEKKLRITEVPISNIYTKDGSTMNPFVHGFGVLNGIIHIISERRPLLFFGLSGSILSIIGLLLGFSVLERSIEGQGLAVGTALISALLIIIGLFSIFTAIILNALKKLKP